MLNDTFSVIFKQKGPVRFTILKFFSDFQDVFATVCKEHYKLISGTKRNCHQRNAAGMLLLLQYQMLPLGAFEKSHEIRDG